MQPATPSCVGITRVHIASTFNAILITVGDNAVALDPADPLKAAVYDRWHQTLSLPPTAALQLHKILTDVLAQYVQAFGPIPEHAGDTSVLAAPPVNQFN